MSWRMESRVTEVDLQVGEALERGLFIAGEMFLGESNQRVPHEYGPLERTGAVSTDIGADHAAVQVSYNDADYIGQAVDQHENMDYHHDEGRSAKFLEIAINTGRDRAVKIVQTQIRRATS